MNETKKIIEQAIAIKKEARKISYQAQIISLIALILSAASLTICICITLGQ